MRTNKYLVTLVFLCCSMLVSAQDYSFDICPETCQLPASFDTVDIQYPIYIGGDSSSVKFRNVRHEYFPAVTAWNPVEANSQSHGTVGNTWCLTTEFPAIFEVIKVVKRPKKYPNLDIKYITLQRVYRATHSESVNCEVLCDWENSQDFMIELRAAFLSKGFSLKFISFDFVQHHELMMAIKSYQFKHNLLAGHLTKETMEHLGMDINKYIR